MCGGFGGGNTRFHCSYLWMFGASHSQYTAFGLVFFSCNSRTFHTMAFKDVESNQLYSGGGAGLEHPDSFVRGCILAFLWSGLHIRLRKEKSSSARKKCVSLFVQQLLEHLLDLNFTAAYDGAYRLHSMGHRNRVISPLKSNVNFILFYFILRFLSVRLARSTTTRNIGITETARNSTRTRLSSKFLLSLIIFFLLFKSKLLVNGVVWDSFVTCTTICARPAIGRLKPSEMII